MRICVVALGRMGVPLAIQFASKGHTVFGADVNPTVVGFMNQGTEPFPLEAGMADRLVICGGCGG